MTIKTAILGYGRSGSTLYANPNRYGDPMVIYPHIAKAIRSEEPYMITLESALGLTGILDAIRKSHETGQVIHL